MGPGISAHARGKACDVFRTDQICTGKSLNFMVWKWGKAWGLSPK
jgi:hypothetical protein